MYQWFNRVTHISDARTEPKLTLEKDETLWCTTNGQVAELKSRTVFSFTREKSQALAHKRGKLSRKGAEAGGRRRCCKLPKRDRRAGVPHPPRRRRPQVSHASCHNLCRRDRAGRLRSGLSPVRAATRCSRPRVSERAPSSMSPTNPAMPSCATSRSSPSCSRGAASPPSTPATCAASASRRPDTCGQNQFLTPYGSDYFYAIHALMLDQPYVGQKTFDVLRVIDWLTDHRPQGDPPGRQGMGQLPGDLCRTAGGCGGSGHAQERADLVPATWPSRKTTPGRSRRSCQASWRSSICPIVIRR